MKLVVERVTSLASQRLTKEPVATLAVDLLPALAGDSIWIVVDGKRERHKILAILTGIEGSEVVAIMEIARPDVAKTIDLAALAKIRGDVETI